MKELSFNVLDEKILTHENNKKNKEKNSRKQQHETENKSRKCVN